MFHVAISQLTTSRWELPEEIARLVDHGFDSIALWRAKLSDLDRAAATSLLTNAGVRVSSLQWVGGFTGGDGRTFAESIGDATEAIDTAAAFGAPAVVVHSGCRGGHTRAHARRLFVQALETLAPLAQAADVTLAVRPLHAAAAAGCSFLDGLPEALEIVENLAAPSVRLALDLWHFGDDPDLPRLLTRLATATAVVQVADRRGPPTLEMERLPVGQGGLPLEAMALALAERGYEGDFEFDPVGDGVASIGYERVLAETRRAADTWAAALAERRRRSRVAGVGTTAPVARSSATDGVSCDRPDHAGPRPRARPFPAAEAGSPA